MTPCFNRYYKKQSQNANISRYYTREKATGSLIQCLTDVWSTIMGRVRFAAIDVATNELLVTYCDAMNDER